MRFQRALPALLTAALLASPALGQEKAGQKQTETAQALTGLVSVEVERAKPQGCTTPPLGPFQPGESCLGPVDRGFTLDWSTPLDWMSPFTTLASPVVTDRGVGFVARADGVVVTAQELVDGADRVTVVLQDGRRLAAETVTVHSGTQTAVLRVEANDLPALMLGEPSELQPGARLDLKTCVLGACRKKGCQHASGIFTGLAKEGDHQGDLFAFFSGVITTSRGAPLLDADGHVVGLNTRLMTVPVPFGAALQFAYATPVDAVRRLVAEVPAREPPPLLKFSLDGLDWDWESLFPDGSLFQPLQD